MFLIDKLQISHGAEGLYEKTGLQSEPGILLPTRSAFLWSFSDKFIYSSGRQISELSA